MSQNIDPQVVRSFGDEWSRFDQSRVSEKELDRVFDSYFRLFPWDRLPTNAVGVDVGCGSGRWARRVSPRVGRLHCVDASADALGVARRNLGDRDNVEFHESSVDAMPIEERSLDFGYSLGVLHHVPDTAGAIRSCVAKLKPGAPFLLYLYYAFDNRPFWFPWIWRASESVRWVVSRSPRGIRHLASDALATIVYLPMARLAGVLEKAGVNVEHLPLSAYRNKSFYVMRNDALDRFGTRLEQRFRRDQIVRMMTEAGLRDVQISIDPPYWTAIGYKH